MNEDKDISRINVVSYTVYYAVRAIGLIIFVVSLIPISLVFGWFMPGVIRRISDGLDEYVKQESKDIDDNWRRLGGKL